MMFVRVGKGRKGSVPSVCRAGVAGPLLAPPPGLAGNQAQLWSVNTKQTQQTQHQTFTFCLETLILPSERAALSDYREVMEQNIFKVVFPQLA